VSAVFDDLGEWLCDNNAATEFQCGGAVAAGIILMGIAMKQFVYWTEVAHQRALLDAKLAQHKKEMWGK
jgi:hypothetical protein